MTIEETVANGDELQILRETRTAIARQMDYCDSGRDMAALSNRMIELCSRISELEKQQSKGKRRKSSIEKARELMNG